MPLTVAMLEEALASVQWDQEQPECVVYYPNRPGWPPDGEWFWRYADGREIPAK